MAFMQGDNKFRPRSKKEKQRLQEQRKRELAAKRERKEQSRNAPSFTPNYSYPQRNQHINISTSGPRVEASERKKVDIEYDEEMQAREQAAREEAERRKKCVAPAYNKGAYQYVATEEDAKLVGRSQCYAL